MKHIITLCLALFFMTGTQNAQAQTKEETVDWIKENLKKYATNGNTKNVKQVKVISVSPCGISYQVIDEDDSYQTYEFNPSYAISWSRRGGTVHETGKTTRMIYSGGDGTLVKRYSSIGNKTVYDSFIYIEEKDTPDIGSRLAKALNHLATFCVQKKEAF